jgi:serine/threonine protein kinase
MATLTESVRAYCVLLARSRLVPAAEVEALYQRWADETRASDDQVEAFVKYLVGRRVLTLYQAVMIQRGHPDGFFLDGYKILDRIGKGQMGGVYKAVHALGQTVALKILPASKAKDPHTLGRFQREARLLTQLDHPNVVRAFQVGEAGGVHYIVMEYLEGETLDEVLARRGRLPPAEAVRLAAQALAGLQHLHERRMVHRDLKPANLMLTPAPAPSQPDTTWDATVKIVDIGLGRELFDENTPEGQAETQLTVEGAVLGTPDYLAPEQARDARAADIRADLYSLGCVLYHSLTGRPPFQDTSIMARMVRHATEPPAPIAIFVPDAPAGLQQVLDRLLAKQPDDRYQTPAAAAEALRPLLTPNAGATPEATSLIPAYRQWLETESGMEVPRGALPPLPAKPGTSSREKAPAPPARDGGSREKSSSRPAAGPAPTVPRPVPPPATSARPSSLSLDEEVDVELVATVPAPVLNPVPQSPPQTEPLPMADDRRLWEWDRRDLIMLTVGGAGVLAAVGLGYGLAQFFRRRRDGEKADEGK